jgi:hypothetical protein
MILLLSKFSLSFCRGQDKSVLIDDGRGGKMCSRK